MEPFIEVHRKGDSEIYDPMSLSKIQNRLRSNSYHHPLEFAADMRRIVTETYRYTAPKDPLIELAGKLQSEFEMMFAKIDFQVRSSKETLSLLFVLMSMISTLSICSGHYWQHFDEIFLLLFEEKFLVIVNFQLFRRMKSSRLFTAD